MSAIGSSYEDLSPLEDALVACSDAAGMACRDSGGHRRRAVLAGALAQEDEILWFLSGGPKGGCPYQQVLAKFPGVSGFDFEVRYTDCWVVHEMGVFGSRSGQREKTLLFLYDGLEAATVTSVDGRTIKIALEEIDDIYCVTGKWQDLNIQYDIRTIRHVHAGPEPEECRPSLGSERGALLKVFRDIEKRLASQKQ
jgi:hypothetical protein